MSIASQCTHSGHKKCVAVDFFLENFFLLADSLSDGGAEEASLCLLFGK
jgi:hypothetical protein